MREERDARYGPKVCATSTTGARSLIWVDFVRITPIVSRHEGVDIAELGAGGGQGDLNQQHELEVRDVGLVGQLMSLCATRLQGQPQLLSSVLQLLASSMGEGVESIKLDDFALNIGTDSTDDDIDMADLDQVPIEKVVSAIAKIVTRKKQLAQQKPQSNQSGRGAPLNNTSKRADGLPKQIVGSVT